MVFRLGSGRFIWRSAARWLPTRTFHDPNPPLTLEDAVASDDPPFGSRRAAQQVAIVTAWHRWRPVGVGGGGGQEAVVAGVPSGRPDQTEILRAWHGGDPWPQQRRSGRIVSVDNPPIKGGDVRPAILKTWEPAPPTPQEKTPTQIQSVDEPPRRAPPDLDLTAWQPVTPAQQPRRLLPQAEAADNPPFGSRTAAINVSIVTAWHRWRRVGGGGGAPQAAADNPPFKRTDAGAAALRAYHTPDEIIEITLSGYAESVDNPPVAHPSRRPGYWPILTAWQPGAPWPLQPRARVVVGVQVDDPPFGSRDDLTGVLRAWQPEDPYRQIRVNYPVQPVVTDDPPFGSLARRPGYWPILSAWQPADPWPQQPLPKVTESGAILPPVVGGDDGGERRRPKRIILPNGRVVSPKTNAEYKKIIGKVLESRRPDLVEVIQKPVAKRKSSRSIGQTETIYDVNAGVLSRLSIITGPDGTLVLDDIWPVLDVDLMALAADMDAIVAILMLADT